MPVRWDASKDQFLLVQLIESTSIGKTEYDRIIATWPAALGEVPTQRAISEHIVKLKNNFKQSLNGDKKTTPTRTNTTQFRTPASRKTNANNAGTNGTGAKRKRTVGDSDDDTGIDTPTHPRIKTEIDLTDNDVDGQGVPGLPERTKLPRTSKAEEKRQRVREYIQSQMNGSGSDSDDAGVGEEYVPEAGAEAEA